MILKASELEWQSEFRGTSDFPVTYSSGLGSPRTLWYFGIFFLSISLAMTLMIGRSCNPSTSYSSSCNYRPIPSPLRSNFVTITSSDPFLPKTSLLRFQSKGARSKEKAKAQWIALQSDISSSQEEMTVDVVIVGASIIGLAIANQIWHRRNSSWLSWTRRSRVRAPQELVSMIAVCFFLLEIGCTSWC